MKVYWCYEYWSNGILVEVNICRRNGKGYIEEVFQIKKFFNNKHYFFLTFQHFSKLNWLNKMKFNVINKL